MRYTDLDPILLDLAREGRTWKKAIARVVPHYPGCEFVMRYYQSLQLATVKREHLYSQKIIFACYYNRNETETVVADQLKQASNDHVLLGLVG